MEIESARIFVKIVEQGSLTKAADLLQIPKSSVSRTLTRLEQQAGTKLLLRTTRNLQLTQAGRTFFDLCLDPVQKLEEARRSIQDQDKLLSGSVRLTAPEDLGIYVVAPVIAKLARQHPTLRFEFTLTDKRVDLVREGYDLAVRIGALPSSRLRARKIGEFGMNLVASPDYLRFRPAPAVPEDLSSHDCLAFSHQWQAGKWVLQRAGKTAHVAVKPKVVGNHVDSLLKMALDGAGIALIPVFAGRREIDDGRLVRVLPAWESTRVTLSLVSPPSDSTPVRARVVADALAAELREVFQR